MDKGRFTLFRVRSRLHVRLSLRGRRLKGKGKGVLGARETRGAREEGGGRDYFEYILGDEF